MVKRPTRIQRRRRILEAARRVFVRQGYAATRMIDIAAEAKVGKGTLYEYFRSKEDLFTTLVVVVARESVEALTVRSLPKEPELALRDAIHYVVGVALGETLDLYRLFFDFWGASGPQRGEAQKQLREVESSCANFLIELIKNGQQAGVFRPEVDARLFVHVVIAAVDGLSIRMVILGQDVDLEAYAVSLADILVSGLKTDQALRGASVLTEKGK